VHANIGLQSRSERPFSRLHATHSEFANSRPAGAGHSESTGAVSYPTLSDLVSRCGVTLLDRLVVSVRTHRTWRYSTLKRVGGYHRCHEQTRRQHSQRRQPITSNQPTTTPLPRRFLATASGPVTRITDYGDETTERVRADISIEYSIETLEEFATFWEFRDYRSWKRAALESSPRETGTRRCDVRRRRG